jgi:hypothetical protein
MPRAWLLAAAVVAALAPGRGAGAPDGPAAPATRPFHLGFTGWPADLTPEGFTTAQEFAAAHGDIVSVMHIGGVPQPEGLDGKPIPKDMQNHLRYRPAAGQEAVPVRRPPEQGAARPGPY